MPRDIYQIRVCQNPDCGLRYPLVEHSTFGERCPMCLGETKSVIEKRLSNGSGKGSTSPLHSSDLCVLLDNIRSALNVGSIFRSADGFGFKNIYLCGITPTPGNPEFNKSAIGAEKYVKWSVHKNAVKLIDQLKKGDCEIWALETSQKSIPIYSAISNRNKIRPLVLILGNEVTGIDPGILEIADLQVYIPMRGQKHSFNVSVAFAVAAQIISFGS
jgi:23S rRNA (guanosine2251-2'-O)-methyltransferase